VTRFDSNPSFHLHPAELGTRLVPQIFQPVGCPVQVALKLHSRTLGSNPTLSAKCECARQRSAFRNSTCCPEIGLLVGDEVPVMNGDRFLKWRSIQPTRSCFDRTLRHHDRSASIAGLEPQVRFFSHYVSMPSRPINASILRQVSPATMNSQSSTSWALKSKCAAVPFTVIVSLAVPGGMCMPPDLHWIDWAEIPARSSSSRT